MPAYGLPSGSTITPSLRSGRAVCGRCYAAASSVFIGYRIAGCFPRALVLVSLRLLRLDPQPAAPAVAGLRLRAPLGSHPNPARLSPSCACVHAPLFGARIASLLRLRAGPRLPALKAAAGPRLPAASPPAPMAQNTAPWSRPRLRLGLRYAPGERCRPCGRGRFAFACACGACAAGRAAPSLSPAPPARSAFFSSLRSVLRLPAARRSSTLGRLSLVVGLLAPAGAPRCDFTTLSPTRAEKRCRNRHHLPPRFDNFSTIVDFRSSSGVSGIKIRCRDSF